MDSEEEHAPIAAATISLARTDSEAAELSAALRALRGAGMSVFVADRSSHNGFRKFLADDRLNVLEGAGGLVEQVRLSVKAAAARARMVLYTEPDKRFFFSDRLAHFLSPSPAASNLAEVVLPSRSAASYETFSASQQRIERAVNEFCSRLFGVQGDYLYGPILFPHSLANCLENFPAEFGWGWRLYLLRVAARRGLKIRLQEMDLPCPENQRADTPEEWLHRMRQHAQNIAGLLFDARAEELAPLRGIAPSWA